jgi:hypothetical protein
MLFLPLLLQAAQPAPLLPPLPLHYSSSEMTCPVGGEHFPAMQATMYGMDGYRPDGKPYSYLPFPLPIPECPSNKLVVFDRFTDTEVAALTRLVASPDYKALLVAEEGPYYRASWLATALGRPEPQALLMLLKAIWGVTPGDMGPRDTPDIRTKMARYQREFVERVRKLPAGIAPDDQQWLELRAANALRQLALFPEAERMRQKAVATLRLATDKGGSEPYLEQLRIAIARKDASIEPLDMIPSRQISFACSRRVTYTDFEKPICTSPEMASQIDAIRPKK